MANKSDFTSFLCKNGLKDAAFWLPQLKKQGVTSEGSLQLLEGDMSIFSSLEETARNPVEKKVLRKLFKIDELEKKTEKEAEDQSAKEKRELQEREDKAKKLLESLEKARSEGLNRHNERVQKLEKAVQDALNIEPKSWIDQDKSLEDLMKKLEERQKIGGQVMKRESLNEKVLLQKVSGGRALQGVLLTKQLEDLFEDRNCLLAMPESVTLLGASEEESTIMQFSSAYQEDQYKKAVDVLGHSTSMSTSIPVYEGVTLGVTASEGHKTEEESTHKENLEEAFSSTVKYSTMHVASYLFQDSDLKLSDEAKSAFRDVLQLVSVKGKSSMDIQEACEKLFRSYGSHVYKGPLKFGGSFCWTCSTRGFNHKDTEKVKKFQSQTVSSNAGLAFAGFGGSSGFTRDRVKASYQGKFSKKLLASSHLDVKITGGPPEATDFSLWKSGLVACNSTWIITDRGNQLLPVWDVIKINHEKELGGVSVIMRQAWEKMTGLKADPDMALLSYISESVLEEVTKWNESILKPQQVQANLDYLLQVRSDIVKKSANPTIWVNKYLLQPAVQLFLESVIHLELKPPHFDHIKLLMQQLIGEQELSLLDSRTFPGIDDVSKWLHTTRPQQETPKTQSVIQCVVDLDSFVSFLKKMHDDSAVTQSQLSIATEVSKGINSFRSCYKETYEDIFITVLIHPFEKGYFDDVITLEDISLDSLLTLCKVFSEQKKFFYIYIESQQFLQLQAYLFKLAVSNCELNQHQLFVKRIKHMMVAVQPPIEQRFLEEVDAYLSGSSLTSFIDSLGAFLTTGSQSCQETPLTVGCLSSLESAMTTAKHQHEASPDSTMLYTHPDVCGLFERLGLNKHYVERLKLTDALCIHQESLQLSLKINGAVPVDPSQLPKLVLHKLMSNDYSCRSDLMQNSGLMTACDDHDDYDEQDDYDEHDDTNDDLKAGIHPIDCLLALLLSSDDLLRQDLFSRLAICQLSIPFILPDPFTKTLILPLWAMRSIVKDWKSKDGTQHSQPIVQYGMPVISFISFGKLGVSKSKMLNEVISESHHHFFHHNLPGGQYNCLLGDGLVDMCWYLPAGKPTDIFPDAVAFLNLHGDARQHSQQSKFLSKISSMCFALLTEEDIALDSQTIENLKAFSSSPGGITVLNGVDKKPDKLKKEIPTAFLVKLSAKTDSQVKEFIRDRITKKLANVKNFQPLEDCTKFKEEGMLIDEESAVFQQGLTLASEVINTITSHEAKESNTKAMMVPLQSEGLWQAWAAQDKELHRQVYRGNATVDHYTSQIKSSKERIRREQLKYISSLTPTVNSFIVSLLKLEGSSNSLARNYFLQCLKLELNNLSRQSISGLRQKYEAARRKFKLAVDASECDDNSSSVDDDVEKLKEEMQALQEGILNASFGLEHLFREIGQVYEAALHSREHGTNLSRLPKVVAELLIEGYPLELMDGDAAHVPVEWITAVFNETVKMLDDPKVIALSVLGLQSTGKSTMLNTVFGLQFNVSAGRCTRGAFVQLLPVDEELRKKTKCSYVLVIDTEGLRAPELDPLKTQKHDNELATFVIGLANMTLINIYGQVPGDMDDILQTSVHAFLRMNLVKYNFSCQFVHQNAETDLSSEIGHEKFTQKLNKFTVDAAKAEKCTRQYKSFNDVIKFDDQRDKHYFPSLWKGDPPMAPVNQGYSQKAQMLKHHFIERVSEGNLATSLSSQCGKVVDLWEALLKENFVFSFKNTLEITVYNSLEAEYGKWDWTFQEGMLSWEHKAENVITTADVKDVPDLVKQKQRELMKYASEDLYKPLKLKMDAFFEGEQKEILAQWKKDFEVRFEHLSQELQDHARKHCLKLGKSREAISNIERVQKEYSDKITEGVQKYISTIKQDQAKLNQGLIKQELEPSQLKEILKKRLFTPENLVKYREEKIISARAESCIAHKCSDDLTEKDLNNILFGGELTIEQVKLIIKRGQETEEELKAKFNEIWIELIDKIPFSAEVTAIEVDVESKLYDYVNSLGQSGLLIQELKEKSFSRWGQPNLELIPKEGIHYMKIKGGIIDFMTSYHHNAVLQVTEYLFNRIRSYKESMEKKETDFNTAFVTEFLHYLTETITLVYRSVQEDIGFTFLFRI